VTDSERDFQEMRNKTPTGFNLKCSGAPLMFVRKSSQRRFVQSVGALSESSAQRSAVWHLPGIVRAALSRAAIDAMRPIKVRVLSRSLPRNRVFEQPPEHRLASASMSIVVPIHDAPLVTKRCLASLERDATKSEIILVDDGSRIAETSHIIREFSSRNGWKVIWNAEARGHSAACAAGARLASRAYLCLLNSDTVVTPWCWRAIEEAFETNTTIGVAGPCTSNSGNEQTLDIAGHCRFYWNDSQICAFAERLTVGAPQPVKLDLPWISGFAFFIRRGLWEKLGGFDRNLLDYGNEVELCKRATNLGYRTAWIRNSYIHHLGRQSYSNKIGDHEIRSRVLAAFQYIRRRHDWQPSNTSPTRTMRTRDK
jgi:GT2 family glycosyltransferase